MTTPSSPHLQADNAMLGIGAMTLAVMCFAGIDAQSKLMGEMGYNAIQITWGRLLIQLLLIAPFVWRMGGFAALRSRTPKLQILRGSLMAGAAIFFVSGLKYMSLPMITSINFISPFLVTLLSIVVLKEKVGTYRWLAIAVGFSGALIIIRPGTDAFDPAAIFPVAAALCWASAMVVIRLIKDGDVTTLLYGFFVGVLITSTMVWAVWVPFEPLAWAYLVGIGLCSTSGQFLMIRAVRLGTPSLVAPFVYTELIWATALGAAIFGDFPDNQTWAGAAIIVASGLYLWQRERQIARSRAASKFPAA